MSDRRQRWIAFREFVDRSPRLGERDFREVAEQLHAEPDAWLRRACVVHLLRTDRDVLSDDQVRELGAIFGGKLETFARGRLIARRLRRDPDDEAVIREARAFDQAWLARRLT